jgi:hypothetical protein
MAGKAGETGKDDQASAAAEAGQLLRRASQLVAERGGWTKSKLARDRHSKPVSPSDERAVRFCVGGALLRAVSERFGVGFRVGDQEALEGEPWFAAYALAHRYLGRALTMLLLSPEAVRVTERRVGANWTVELALGGEHASAETVAKTSWVALVQRLNDHRKVKHRDILTGLALARMFSVANEIPGEGAPGVTS